MSTAARIPSRWRKLRAMSAAEIVSRTRYRAVLEWERLAPTKGLKRGGDPLTHALGAEFSDGDWRGRLLLSRRLNRPRFFPGVRERAALRELFEQHHRTELQDTFLQARRAREGRFAFFGQEFLLGTAVDWHADPVSGRRWPLLFHAHVPVHKGDVGFGDVKYVWELNRHQFLIDLGKAHFLGEDADNLNALAAFVRSWMPANPCGRGVNWACALEPAFRSLSWLWAYFLTSDDLDDAFHLEWLRGFHEHAGFIATHLEHYSSPYNHLIGEAAALYMLGTSFPEFKESARWREVARTVLEGRLAEQFYADGGSVEQSTFYHHATLGFYLLAALAARNAGEELSARVWQAIEKALDFSLALVQPDGRIPEIGGADDGKPIRMQHLPLWDFRPYLSMGAVLFGRPDLKHVAGRFHEDAVWLLGSEGKAKFDALPASPPEVTSRVLERSGYAILRSDWGDAADYLCFDCGEQAAGIRTDAVPNSMHGHADCLSVITWLRGRRVLVDSGFYAYNCGGSWEAHFRQTAAHNTARVDARDQATHLGKMAWAFGYRATLESWSAAGPHGWVLGSHDGYARGSDGVIHRRAASLQSGYLVLYDEFTGTGSHEFEVNFQFAPGVLEPVDERLVLFDRLVQVVWVGNVAWQSEIRCGGPSPQDGWIAPSLGVRRAAPRLTLRALSARPPVRLVTVLALGAVVRSVPVDTAAYPTDAQLPICVGDPDADESDWIATPMTSAHWGIATDGLLAICRLRGNTVAEIARVGATYLHADAARLTALRSIVHHAGGGA